MDTLREHLDGIGWLGWSMLALALVLFGIALYLRKRAADREWREWHERQAAAMEAWEKSFFAHHDKVKASMPKVERAEIRNFPVRRKSDEAGSPAVSDSTGPYTDSEGRSGVLGRVRFYKGL